MNDFDLDQAREKEGGEELEFLCVRMTDAVYGFELPHIREIIWDSRITLVPCVPDYYEGLCNWKGTIITAASLSRMTGTKESGYGDQPVVIITETGALQCGFLVREEPEILRVPADARLTGDTPDRIGEILKIKAAYAWENEVIYVIDAEETLKCMVIFD